MSTAVIEGCGCKTCTISAALRLLEGGIDVWLDEEFNRSMSLYYLADEVREAVKNPRMPATTRRRLVAALDCIDPCRKPPTNASPTAGGGS